MPGRFARLAAAAVMALALGASPALAAGSPLTHISYPANWVGSICGYTFTSGAITEVFLTADALDGEIDASHATFHAVVATRDGASYRVVGAEIYDDLTGHQTWKMMFIATDGGIADSINIVFRAGRAFDPADPIGSALVAHERDSCHVYG